MIDYYRLENEKNSNQFFTHYSYIIHYEYIKNLKFMLSNFIDSLKGNKY